MHSNRLKAASKIVLGHQRQEVRNNPGCSVPYFVPGTTWLELVGDGVHMQEVVDDFGYRVLERGGMGHTLLRYVDHKPRNK
jgi:hypothetical protein